MDRSLVDTLAYMRKDGCKAMLPQVEQLARAASYNTVLFCAPVGEHGNRPEDYSEAMRISQYIREAYIDLGVELIDIAPISVEARVEYIFDTVGDRLRCHER
jgi:predicted ATPase